MEDHPGKHRDREARAEVREIRACLNASRPTPEKIKVWIERLEVISKNTVDNRAAMHAQKALLDLYKWQVEYEMPKDQNVNLNHTGLQTPPAMLNVRIITDAPD